MVKKRRLVGYSVTTRGSDSEALCCVGKPPTAGQPTQLRNVRAEAHHNRKAAAAARRARR